MPYDYYSQLVLGKSESLSRRTLIYRTPIPSHFGYDSNIFVTSELDPIINYMITTKLDTLYSRIFPDNALSKISYIYTEDDFMMLMADPNVIRIYTNGEFDLWGFPDRV